MSNDLLRELVRRKLPVEDKAVIGLRPDPPDQAGAAVFAMRETAIIAAAGFLIFVTAAALLVHSLVP